MTHDELQKVRNALAVATTQLAVATTHFARDRIIVLDAIVILNNALAEPSQRIWVGLTDEEIDSYFEDHGWSPSEYYYPVIKDIEAKLKEKNT